MQNQNVLILFTENDFNSNITGSDLNSVNETISDYRMFLKYIWSVFGQFSYEN